MEPWVLGFLVGTSFVCLGSLGVTLFFAVKSLSGTPQQLRTDLDTLEIELRGALNKMRADVADTLDQVAEMAERMQRDRKAAQVERGRAEKAKRVQEDQPRDVSQMSPQERLSYIRQMAAAQGKPVM